MVKNDPIFGRYENTFVPQDVDSDPLKNAFRDTIEIDNHNSDGDDFVPKNEEEAKSARLFDEMRKKYFDLKFEWFAVKNFDNL